MADIIALISIISESGYAGIASVGEENEDERGGEGVAANESLPES